MVLSSVFVGNEAQNGGGVYIQECVHSTFFDNSFTSNEADKSGAGIFQLKCSGALPSAVCGSGLRSASQRRSPLRNQSRG